LVEQENQVKILSKVKAPERKGDPAQNFRDIEFETIIYAEFDEDLKFTRISFETEQTKEKSEDDYDFVQLIFDSEEDEKVYGMGLQYTVTDFKGHLVNMVSSEGGVGRGLQPLTDMLNTENKN